MEERKDIFKPMNTGFDPYPFENVNDMNDLFNIPVAWLFEKSEKKNEFVLNNEIYKVKEDLNQISIAEYISLANYIKSVEDYDKLIAIILRKEGEKYDSTKIIEKAKLVREQLKGSDIRIINRQITITFIFRICVINKDRRSCL